MSVLACKAVEMTKPKKQCVESFVERPLALQRFLKAIKHYYSICKPCLCFWFRLPTVVSENTPFLMFHPAD